MNFDLPARSLDWFVTLDNAKEEGGLLEESRAPNEWFTGYHISVPLTSDGDAPPRMAHIANNTDTSFKANKRYTDSKYVIKVTKIDDVLWVFVCDGPGIPCYIIAHQKSVLYYTSIGCHDNSFGRIVGQSGIRESGVKEYVVRDGSPLSILRFLPNPSCEVDNANVGAILFEPRNEMEKSNHYRAEIIRGLYKNDSGKGFMFNVDSAVYTDVVCDYFARPVM
jgi:hypothetical protein